MPASHAGGQGFKSPPVHNLQYLRLIFTNIIIGFAERRHCSPNFAEHRLYPERNYFLATLVSLTAHHASRTNSSRIPHPLPNPIPKSSKPPALSTFTSLERSSQTSNTPLQEGRPTSG